MIDDKSVPMNYFAAYDEVSLYIELDNFKKNDLPKDSFQGNRRIHLVNHS